MSNDPRFRQRLAWRCRRGLLELDLVLQDFVRADFEALGEDELRVLEEMLEEDDHLLWALVSGRGECPQPHWLPLIKRLRAYGAGKGLA